jgi:signal transduction histidine kinase
MIDDQIRRIFIHVRTAVCELMDVARFYVALYEQNHEQLSFPLVWRGDGELPDDQPPWIQRELDERWLLDRALLQDKVMRPEPGVLYWPEGEEQPQSWLAVPMTVSEEIKIALVVENWQHANAFGEDALRFLDTIARQAAMSIRNVQLVRDWQEAEKKRRAAERFLAVNQVAGEFAHSMNNIAGTVPVWIKMARANLDLNDKKQAEVLQFLDEIDTATRRLLQKAQEVREATKQRAREPVEVNALVNNAIKRAMASQPNAGERILVEKELGSGLPKIEVERDSFIDTLTSIVKNGLESMSNRGTLRVLTRHARKTGNPSIEIVVSDSGAGISEENLSKIFDPFFTTKETGMGFGLWRDKTVIEELGGQINVDSALAKGTTFTIRLPVK